MKRSGFGPRKTPMARGSWSRKSSPLPEQAPRKKAMTRRAKRPSVAEGSKYLAACRGEPCYLRMRGCLGGGETVVPCHSNQAKHGKGMGIKARHEFTVPGCSNCHSLIDQGPGLREQKFAAWNVAYEAWAPVRARKMGEANCQ
ncbi:nuclease domain-containing protein [Burkholderia sp. BCCIQ04A]|uniref:Nuclease domain-containing protein n=1 Tax=Burkholderia anthinoferrum TaxID=3090833 RepID=A0ABU5WPE2_9BURK|nr:nuclease domain-containing protein [Burkholderia anthinoferrum]MEB2504618.1 nuclease domain-containing protein [Burkholderia anthinoferrum]MEB2530287.1 nuclease domain-containing protein [Burkholderia anthinoferrum]MEB2561660.1 nuclease domain-containing protein [Burkholderia anthinoferrum]MEB2580590.1 nuclease domain-containing protein [Burkholderia anthinoferrum]MEB2634432.1 nuclease domain-containing protein [Burkholderia anthinoferrum]